MDKAGYGLIETMRVRDGRIPFLERHLARLRQSLGELGLPKPSQDVAVLVKPFAATGDAVLRVEVPAVSPQDDGAGLLHRCGPGSRRGGGR